MAFLRGALIAVVATALLLGCGGKPRRVAQPRAPGVAPLPAEVYAHYLRGRLAVYDEKYDVAVDQFKAAIRLAPGEPRLRVALIDALFLGDHDQRARAVAKRSQELFPRDPEVWRISGRLYREADDLPAAIEAYRRAIELDRELHSAYLGLAAAYRAGDQRDRAEETYRALLRVDPDSVSGHYRLAVLLLERKQYQEAEAQLRQVLELDPDHVNARVALARSLHARGRERESIDTLRHAFDRSGGDPEVGEQLFVQLLEDGDRDGARNLLGILDRDDLDSATRISFGYLYLQIGEPALAARLAEELVERDPANGFAVLLAARAAVGLGQDERAVALALAVTPGQTGYAECHAYAAERLARSGDPKRALAVAEAALAHDPGQVDLLASQAMAYRLAGDGARARAVYQEALASRPDDPDLLYGLAELEERLGDPDRGVDLVEKILAADPDNPVALNYIGYSLADRNLDLDRADKLLRRAVQLDPSNGYVLDSYGWLMFRKGRVDQAHRLLERAARLAPAEPEILLHLGVLARAANQPRRALKLLEKARSFRPEGEIRDRIDAQIRALRTDK